MANVSTPTEMVACDQLYKATLQKLNSDMSDKQAYIESLTCTYPQHKFNTVVSDGNEGYTMNTCTNCPIESVCKSKEAIETNIAELSELIKTKNTLMKKYSELQDKILEYLKS